MNKKPVIAFTVASEENYPFAKQLESSLRKFHSEKELPLKIVSGQTLHGHLGVDSKFMIRHTATLAEELIKEYELVIKIDAHSIITGKLDYVLNTTDYDVATIRDYNRHEVPPYIGVGILPVDYMSTNFVALRSEKFIHQWYVNCDTPQFDRLQYKEQDVFNVICYFGNYNVRVLDDGDGIAKHLSYYGNASRAFWPYMKVKKDALVIPADNNDLIRKQDRDIRILNFRGQLGERINHKTKLNKEVITYIEKLVK